MKTSLRIWLAALAAGLSFILAIHAALGWRGFAQIKERKNPAPAPTPRPVRTPTSTKVIRPTPTPAPRPTPTPIPPPALVRSFSFETVTLDRRGGVISRETRQTRYFVVELGGGVTLEMVEIPGGSFMMGSHETEAGRNYIEDPQHRVVAPPFWMGKFEVTQAQWKAVMGGGANPSHFKGDELPVENVSWVDAQTFLDALNQKQRLQNKGGEYRYRLPSEAEWEYAARASADTPFAFGETITPQIVNYNGSMQYANGPEGIARKKTIAVGSLGVANAFGLFDMHGNVWEWCEDVFRPNYNGAPTDGSAWLGGGSHRALRGGSWTYEGRNCRSAARAQEFPDERSKDVGFRVALSASVLQRQNRRE